MIYFKILLALLLSVLPFFYASYIRPKEKTSKVWRNMFTALATQLPRLSKAKNTVANFLNRLYDGMKKSDNFRKFFTLVTLLLMIAVQFVDFSASTEIARGIREISHSDAITFVEIKKQLAHTIAVYGPLMTKPHASVLAACMSLTLFSYMAADWLLSRLHNRQKFFFGVAMLALVILFASPRYIIVSEMLEMLLMAAMIYPNKIPSQDPKGRKPIPIEQQHQAIQKAA